MAFTLGALAANANFTVEFAGPLDCRAVCDYVADLVTAPYPYKGMLVSVVNDSTSGANGVYVLKGDDATSSANWAQVFAF